MTGPDRKRLVGVRALVTRPKERARELCFLLEDEGAQWVCLPLLELLPPRDDRPLRSAAERVGRYAWVLFASPWAVQALVEAAREGGSTAQLKRVKLAAIGPQTARALRSYGLEVMKEAAASSGAGLFESLKPELSPGDEVLLPAAEEGRRELEEALAAHGIRATRVAAYRSAPTEVDEAAAAALRRQPPQVIFFGSPRTVEAFVDRLGELARELVREAKVVAIGPATAAAAEALGLPIGAVALRPTPEGLLEAALRALGRLC